MTLSYEPILFTKVELEEITGGRWLQNEPKNLTIKGLFIASEFYNSEHVFIATGGFSVEKRSDLVLQTMKRGVVASIIDQEFDQIPSWASVFIVDDASAANRKLANYSRNRSRATFIGITGSAGKTSTKETIATLLASQDTTFSSYMSVNGGEGLVNQVSLLPEKVKYAVFEIGMLGPNTIKKRAELIKPQVAIITSIGSAHLAYHKGMDSIINTKTDIVKGLTDNGTVLVPRDSEYFDKIVNRCKALNANISIYSFGEHTDSDCVLLECIPDSNGSLVKAKILDQSVEYYVSIPGNYWALNSIAALACIRFVGADVCLAAKALSSIRPIFRRGERFRVEFDNKVIELIDDTFNANSASMNAAISLFPSIKLPAGGRKIAVLGDMEELGENEISFHRELLLPLQEAQVDLVCTVGEKMKHLHRLLTKPMQGLHAATSVEMAQSIKGLLKNGDIVLVKGSHKSAMNRVVVALIGSYKSASRVPFGWNLHQELK